MKECFENVELFHVHIPKTAGTSLNAMLGKCFQSQFCDHNPSKLQKEPNVVVAASHTTLLSAMRVFPNAKFVTVLRSPEARLKSTIRHLYARRNWPAYSDIGPVIDRLIDDKGAFKVDVETLQSKVFRERFDNLQVRYLSLEKVGDYVNDSNLQSAKSSRTLFHAALLQESFDADAKSLMESIGKNDIKIEKENKAKSLIPLWDEIPSELFEYIKYDIELYNFFKS